MAKPGLLKLTITSTADYAGDTTVTCTNGVTVKDITVRLLSITCKSDVKVAAIVKKINDDETANKYLTATSKVAADETIGVQGITAEILNTATRADHTNIYPTTVAELTDAMVSFFTTPKWSHEVKKRMNDDRDDRDVIFTITYAQDSVTLGALCAAFNGPGDFKSCDTGSNKLMNMNAFRFVIEVPETAKTALITSNQSRVNDTPLQFANGQGTCVYRLSDQRWLRPVAHFAPMAILPMLLKGIRIAYDPGSDKATEALELHLFSGIEFKFNDATEATTDQLQISTMHNSILPSANGSWATTALLGGLGTYLTNLGALYTPRDRYQSLGDAEYSFERGEFDIYPTKRSDSRQYDQYAPGSQSIGVHNRSFDVLSRCSDYTYLGGYALRPGECKSINLATPLVLWAPAELGKMAYMSMSEKEKEYSTSGLTVFSNQPGGYLSIGFDCLMSDKVPKNVVTAVKMLGGDLLKLIKE